VRGAAQRVLADWRPLLATLPFRPGETIVAFGDSITDDSQSWAEILREVLVGMFPEHPPRVVNLGRSGDTSAHLIERFRSVAALDPDWLVIMVGNNDAKAFTSAPDTPLVSPGETARNVRLLDRLGRATGAEVLWLAEPRVEPALVAGLDQWRVEELVWSNDLVDASRAAVLAEVDAIDLEPAFRSELFLPDGLHPNLEGQLTILRAVLEGVSEG
jgi:lysophospholipase L1-like esterase